MVEVENIAPTTASAVFHRHLLHEPVLVDHAKGAYLYLKDGRRILDGCGGAAVISVGHARSEVVTALTEQLKTLSYVHSVAFANQAAEELAAILTKSADMARAVFFSGGTEALESSLKLVRQYHIEIGQPERVNFIGRDRSYHGNSLATLGLARHRQRRAPYEALFAKNFYHVSAAYAYRYQLEKESEEKYVERLVNELEAKILELGSQTVAAFYAETIAGATTGCVPAPQGYFKGMKAVCDRYGVLLVLDEIMCGMGRSGKLHAWQWEGVQPDLQVVGKAMGGGFAPISAVLINEKVVNAFQAGTGAFNNRHTFQSHVIGCRSALEVMKLYEKEKLVEQCQERGQLLSNLLRARLELHPNVGNIRGRGLFWGVEFVQDSSTKACLPADVPFADLVEVECMNRGLIVYPGTKGTFDSYQGDHILISPPYTIAVEEIHFLVDTLVQAIDAAVDILSSKKKLDLYVAPHH
ncbi:MAG: hypothetical protein CYPHOPRED_001771 [Cyphobasidiales sp. Tagirdzhanova-0007]|nr:MAG: hypothetical protein CYPHOPRED_001771 [Cyphobasidiales sp. Tagirdzhanova-0007]